MAEKKRKTLHEPPSLQAQERLIEIMCNSPRLESFAGTQWEITALKPGTQWLIAREAVAICKAESASYEDVIKQFALNTPAVVRVLTLALLNSRERIFEGGVEGHWSEEFISTYETILWHTKPSEWIDLLVVVLSMLDIEVFFSTTASIQMIRRSLLERKMTRDEARLLSRAPSGGK